MSRSWKSKAASSAETSERLRADSLVPPGRKLIACNVRTAFSSSAIKEGTDAGPNLSLLLGPSNRPPPEDKITEGVNPLV